MDSLFLAIFGVAFVFPLIKLLSIWSSNGLIETATKENKFLKKSYYEVIYEGQVARMTDYTSAFWFFDETSYYAAQFKNFYVAGVIGGEFWIRWVEWFFDGGLLLWTIMTLSLVEDIIQLATLTFLFGALMILAYAHEHVNRIKLTNVDLAQPFVQEGDEILINRKSKKWHAYVLGLLSNVWIFTLVFVYYGYSYVYEGGAGNFQWFRLTIPPIGAFFYLLLIPVIVLAWSLWRPTYYKDIRLTYPTTRTASNPNPEPIEDSDLMAFFNEGKSEDPYVRFSEMGEPLQKKVVDYMAYQDWNKNYMYEIVMMSVAGICKHVIIWILWGGMLGQ